MRGEGGHHGGHRVAQRKNFNPCLKTSFNADYADYRRLKSMFFRVIRIWKMHHRVHRVSQRERRGKVRVHCLYTLNHKPSTLNLKPSTLIPHPSTEFSLTGPPLLHRHLRHRAFLHRRCRRRASCSVPEAWCPGRRSRCVLRRGWSRCLNWDGWRSMHGS